MTLLALTSDWHFGLYRRLSTPHPSGATSRLMDQLKCWEWAVDTAVTRNADALVVAGDLFDDRSALDLTVLDLVCRAMYEASQRIPLHVLIGNHDSHLRHPAINSVQALRGIATVIEHPAVIAGVGYIPWTEDYTGMLAAVNEMVRLKVKTLVAHTLVSGVTGNDGLPLDYLRAGHFDRVWLGDVHEPLEVAENVKYIGAPMQHDYRDVGGLRGILLYDVDTDEADYAENTFSPKFHIFDAPLEEGESVAEQDFVRVTAPDATVATSIAANLKTLTPNVECTTAAIAASEPRIKLAGHEPQADVLRRYVQYLKPQAAPEQVAELVAVGMKLWEGK